MDFVRPIGGERDVDPLQRVARLKEERERREQQRRRRPGPQPPSDTPEGSDEGPVEGDDGHLHIDIRA